ncbi:MAG TPA: lysylphosphatidylglycerol synthase transmembrane domain-containing protein [Bryobacteraceae bacterium]|nr:lysylphosphatidylglycerol synthase transmembrane domain-containing protein [Bryobacteraceae bacterium]
MDPAPVKKTRRKVPRWAVLLATYAISIASLVWALSGYDFSQIQVAILSVRWGWVLLAVVLELAVYLLQAWRWLTLLSPIERMGLWETAQAIYIGLFASDVLPLRPGEIIRCYLLAVWGEIPISLTLTSAAIERVLDGIWLVGAFWALATVMTLPRAMVDSLPVLAFAVFALTALFLYILFRKHHAHSVLSKRDWGRKFLHVLDQIHQMGQWRTLAKACGITFLYWLMQILPVWALFRAYDMDLSFWPASAVLIIKSVGTLIPSAPGNLGVFQSVVKLALTMFSVEPNVALELSVLMWAAMTLPPLIVGFVAVLLTGLSIGEIHRHAHAHHRHYLERRGT